MINHRPHIVPAFYRGKRVYRCYTHRNPHRPSGGVGLHGSGPDAKTAYAQWLKITKRNTR